VQQPGPADVTAIAPPEAAVPRFVNDLRPVIAQVPGEPAVKSQAPVGEHAVVPAAVVAHEKAPVAEQAVQVVPTRAYPTLQVTHVVPLH